MLRLFDFPLALCCPFGRLPSFEMRAALSEVILSSSGITQSRDCRNLGQHWHVRRFGMAVDRRSTQVRKGRMFELQAVLRRISETCGIKVDA